MKHTEQEATTFMKQYEAATNTHNFSQVKPLLDPKPIYWFSDGTHETIEDLEKAFVKTWNTIQEEKYMITNIQWVALEETAAVCTYTFHWKGIIDGKEEQGEGRGTNVLIKKDNKWYMKHEHLSTEEN